MTNKSNFISNRTLIFSSRMHVALQPLFDHLWIVYMYYFFLREGAWCTFFSFWFLFWDLGLIEKDRVKSTSTHLHFTFQSLPTHLIYIAFDSKFKKIKYVINLNWAFDWFCWFPNEKIHFMGQITEAYFLHESLTDVPPFKFINIVVTKCNPLNCCVADSRRGKTSLAARWGMFVYDKWLAA